MASGFALIDLVGRLLITFVFLFQAIAAIKRFNYHSDRLRSCHIPAPQFVLACGLAMMIVGSVMVLFNVHAALGASLLIIFSIAATILFRNFWSFEGADRREKLSSFLSNLSIIGGLLLVIVCNYPRQHVTEGLWNGGYAGYLQHRTEARREDVN